MRPYMTPLLPADDAISSPRRRASAVDRALAGHALSQVQRNSFGAQSALAQQAQSPQRGPSQVPPAASNAPNQASDFTGVAP